MENNSVIFGGLGNVPKITTTFYEGFGLGGSFAPAWTTSPTIRQYPVNTSIDPLKRGTFTIATRAISGVVKYGVLGPSYLLKSNKLGDQINVTGLITTGDDNDNWFSLGNNQNIWLEITVDNYDATSAYINYGTAFTDADAWLEGSYVENDGATPPSQILARKLLGGLNGSGKLFEITNSNYILADVAFAGRAAIYPIPA